MDPELLEYLQGMEGRLNQRLGEQIQHFRGEIQHDIQHLRDEIQHDIQQAKDETLAASRDMQTEVIRYIGNLATPFNVRMRHLEANAGNLDTAQRLRLAAVEERLLRIEKKVLGESPDSK